MNVNLRFAALGRYLKCYRKNAGFTQWEVAKELGYTSPQFISNFERGLCAPSLDTLVVLMKMYNIPRQELMDLLLKQHEEYLKDKLQGGE